MARMRYTTAFGHSGKWEEKRDYFYPVTMFHPNFKKQDALPNAAGGLSGVWKAKLANDPTGTIFVLNVLRVTQQDGVPGRKGMIFLSCIRPTISHVTLSDSVRMYWLPNKSKMTAPRRLMASSFASYPNGWNAGTRTPTSGIMKSLTAPSLSVLDLIRNTPFPTLARRDKGSQLLTLHRSNSRRLKERKPPP